MIQYRRFLQGVVNPMLLSLLIVGALSLSVQAEKYKLPPLDNLIRSGRSAHEMCLSGRNRHVDQPLVNVEHRARGGSPNQERYDVLHYDIRMKFNRDMARIEGDVAMTVRVVAPLDRCEIDCYWMMQVDSVKVNGKVTSHFRDWDRVTVLLDRTYSIGERPTTRVFYHGFEPDFQWWALHFETFDGQPIVGSLAEPFYARAWWPCKDYPNDKADSLDFRITYPSQYFCSSNGSLISDVDLGTGFRTTHWSVRYPIATYLVSVSMAEFTYWREWALRTDTDSLPVDYWVYPGLAPTAQQTYQITVPAIDTLSRIFGTYPFPSEKYAMSGFMWGGAMEHQTNSSMSEWATGEPMVIVHELSHQWWGDMITCRDWHHIWLNEGFASYAEALLVESVYGPAAYRSYMASMEYFAHGSIYVQDTTNSGSILSTIVYDKGAWVLHMLRGVIGDSAFFEGLRNYGDSPLKFGTAVTEDFQYYMEQSAGVDLDWFFSEWIYGQDNPAYEYKFQCQQTTPGVYQVDLVVEQVQTIDQVFDMPVTFGFQLESGSVIEQTFNVNSRFKYVYFEFSDSVVAVTIDPNNWVLETHTQIPFGLTVVSRDLPPGEVGQNYQTELEALGGTQPYTWSLYGGDLPFGTSFSGGSQGIIDGVPSYAATYYFTIRAVDSSVPPDTILQDLHIVVNNPVIIGDCNQDGNVSIADAVYIINYIFAGGPEPIPYYAGDTDCSSAVSIADAVRIINYIFVPGSTLCEP